MMRNKVLRKFKMRGYTLKIESLTEIIAFVSRFPEFEDQAIDLLIDELHHVALKSSILDKETVHKVITRLLEADDASFETKGSVSALTIIDAFDFPKFRYDQFTKLFHRYTGNRVPIHGDAIDKVTLYRNRFLLLLQRLSRDSRFFKPIFEGEIAGCGSCQISKIQSLEGRKGNSWVMGLISQLEDGHFYLEDLTAIVAVDLSNARIKEGTAGFFAENIIVLAEGKMSSDGNIFQVKTLDFPPQQDREKSLTTFSGTNFFGGSSLTKEETIKLAYLERGAVDEMFVILSDVWLDNEETLENLETILSGYEIENVVPSLFVFMGNFCSHPCNLSFKSYTSLRSQFGNLGKMLASHQRLKEHSRFLFIPGPDDVGPSNVLPRCSLPKYITEELQNHIPNAVFSSNPCRVKFYAQEIVFLRNDMLYSMRRSCLMPPSKDDKRDPFQHLVATIIHQSHLCPLPLSKQPIVWNFDHCLHLFPIPHTIILADTSKQNAVNIAEGITCFNPGSFSIDSTYVSYRPCSRDVKLLRAV